VSLTIRGRLTLWYTAVLLAVLVLFGAWVYVVEGRLRLDAVDADLGRAASAVALAVAAELDEGAPLEEAATEAYKDFFASGRALEIRSASGARLAGENGPPPFVAPAAGASDDRSTTFTRAGEDWRAFVHRHGHEGASYDVVIAEPLARAYAQQGIVRRTLVVGIPLALALAAAGGWWIARRALAPVGMMVAQARQASGQEDGFRLRVPREEDELGVLARAFNELLARVEGVLHAQRQFMADASHELRTPVSIAHTAAEVTLARDERTPEEYRDALRVVGGQAARLGRMVEDMMTLARADAGGLAVERADLYLDELVADCAAQAAVLAQAGQVEVAATASPETAFHGDERLLRQMVMNLLHNAIRHSPARGRVEASVTASNGFVEIAVVDGGPGVPEADRARIFERFVRLDAARSRPGGAGLGLPIARCIAEAHGGRLTLAASGPSGSTFLVRLPRRECGA